MRFAVSHVMDMIERRLTTDVALAQAVVDLGEVVRYAELDSGRAVSLVRLGMVVDALGRYFVDEGAILYPVAQRTLLSEAEFTSKERMVLGRWADDGIIEVTADADGRAVEVADFTGLPVITVRSAARHASKYPWLRDTPERVLRLLPRGGVAVLVPDGDDISPPDGHVVVGKARVKPIIEPEETPGAESEESLVVGTEAEQPQAEQPQAEQPQAEQPQAEQPQEGQAASGRPAEPAGAVVAFLPRGVTRISSMQVMRQRVARAEPSGIGAALLSHQWRCPERECQAFSEFRRIGQPVPRMTGGLPVCPRHGAPLSDIGPRPPAYAMAVVVDDLPRQRFVVTEGQPVTVGRAPKGEHDIAVSEWLHSAAARWISAQHVRFTVCDGALVVTDISRNGTMIWKRPGRDDPGVASRLAHSECSLDGWDSIELYTGVELLVVDHRGSMATGSALNDRTGGLRSVLVDAPTVAFRRPDGMGVMPPQDS